MEFYLVFSSLRVYALLNRATFVAILVFILSSAPVISNAVCPHPSLTLYALENSLFQQDIGLELPDYYGANAGSGRMCQYDNKNIAPRTSLISEILYVEFRAAHRSRMRLIWIDVSGRSSDHEECE